MQLTRVGSQREIRSHPARHAVQACIGLVIMTVLVGCGGPGHSKGNRQPAEVLPLPNVGQPGNSRLCDSVIPTGAMSPVFLRLKVSSGPQPVAPSRTSLPRPLPSGQRDYSAARYVRTSSSCAVGAIVVVSPSTNASLVISVPSKDGAVAAIGLDVTSPITVRAWVGGHYQGALKLNP